MTSIGVQSRRAAPSAAGLVERHPVAAYVVLTFAISWGGVLMIVGLAGLPGTSEQFRSLLPLVAAAMLAGPAAAGILLTGTLDGRAGLRELRSRMLAWRADASWYAMALLAAPLAALAVTAALSLVFPGLRPGILASADRSAYLALGVALAVGAGIFEELGWTGFATPRLRRRHGVVTTGLIVGFLWSAWHLLVGFWATGNGYTGDVPTSVFLVAGLFSTLLVFRVLMVWVYEHTGSLFVAILMHASLTATVRILTPVTTGAPLLAHDVGMAAALWLVVGAIALATGGDLTRRPPVTARRPRRSRQPQIHGYVSPGFEPVRDAFVENFAARRELGGACCVYHRGERVVDLWGGIRNEKTGEPWNEDTMVVVWSATKGLSAMTLALAHSRGLLDYDERVATYWPEFAQNGKEAVTVRQLLAHQAGLFAFDEPVDREVIADPDRLAVVLARQKPAWTPGTRQSYHALTLGFHQGELLRRIDPRRRTLGRFFQEEIATPLELDFHIRLPESIPSSRLATLSSPGRLEMLLGFPIGVTIAGFNHRSDLYRALMVNPGTGIVLDTHRVYARDFEVPSGGGVGTARAIAHAYGVFANGGHELGLQPSTLSQLAAPATPPTKGFHDDGLKGDVRFSLGFMKPGPVWHFGSAASFGSPGSGGSLGYADPVTGVGYGYVTSRMGTTLTGDPRDVALREALDFVVPPVSAMRE